MEELNENVSSRRVGQVEEGQTKVYFCLIPLESSDDQGSDLGTLKVKRNVRFPCIHRKEPVDFHSSNILP